MRQGTSGLRKRFRGWGEAAMAMEEGRVGDKLCSGKKYWNWLRLHQTATTDLGNITKCMRKSRNSNQCNSRVFNIVWNRLLNWNSLLWMTPESLCWSISPATFACGAGHFFSLTSATTASETSELMTGVGVVAAQRPMAGKDNHWGETVSAAHTEDGK